MSRNSASDTTVEKGLFLWGTFPLLPIPTNHRNATFLKRHKHRENRPQSVLGSPLVANVSAVATSSCAWALPGETKGHHNTIHWFLRIVSLQVWIIHYIFRPASELKFLLINMSYRASLLVGAGPVKYGGKSLKTGAPHKGYEWAPPAADASVYSLQGSCSSAEIVPQL